MRKHVATWINDALLVQLDGQFSGVVSAVTEQTVRNRFTAQREQHPVISFADGHCLVPNTGMRRALIEMLGPQTEQWVGRRLTITRRRVERTNRETGKTTSTFEKAVSCPDAHARVVPINGRESLRTTNAEQLTAEDIPWDGPRS